MYIKLTELLDSLQLWRKGAFEGMKAENLLEIMETLQGKLNSWKETCDVIDKAYKTLTENMLSEIESIVKKEGLEEAIARRF